MSLYVNSFNFCYTSLQNLFQKYEEWLSIEGNSYETRLVYGSLFIQQPSANITLDILHHDDIFDYLQS